jgi:ATP-dependent HslUV protease ATP-binding subunit HslU
MPLKQYRALLAEGLDVEFTEDAVEAVASFSMTVNERMENIGARRLHTIMERVLDGLSFQAPTSEAVGHRHRLRRKMLEPFSRTT